MRFMPAKHLSIGQLGEDIACHYLQKRGYRVLVRNYTNTSGIRLGEIDIIARYKGQIVFVEVKTRIKKGVDALPPEANINRDKLRKLDKIAQVYLRETKQLAQSYSFDAVSVLIDELTNIATVKHLPGIFL
jgi:putative endonuclease